MKVVVIEDSKTQAEHLRATLETQGFEVLVTHDGESGLDACRSLEHPPAAVISDVIMPGIDGYEVCRRLKQDPRFDTVPIMLLTALADPADVIQAIAAGADNFLTKPYREETLIPRLRRLIAHPPECQDHTCVAIGDKVFRLDAPRARLVEVLVSSLVDASARYHELERSRAALAQTHAEREALMRVVVHELRTPLQTLRLLAALCRESPEDLNRLRAMPETVEKQVSRIIRIIDDLSDVTRIEMGTLRVQPREADLVVVVREAMEHFGSAISTHTLVLEANGSMLLRLDVERMEQVVTNLLSNAVKYSPPQSQVLVTVSQAGHRARVEVRDQGIGIEPHALSRVFERYFRTSTGKSRAEGVGLGLYICKHLVEAHGGTIGVDSQLARGTTFWLELPIDC